MAKNSWIGSSGATTINATAAHLNPICRAPGAAPAIANAVRMTCTPHVMSTPPSRKSE